MIKLHRHLCRFSTFYPEGDPAIPAALSTPSQPAVLSGIEHPLPSRREDYTCQAATRDGVVWYGAKTGLTRYDPAAAWPGDRVMYFSATRDLPHNEVLSLLPAAPEDERIYEALWVRTAEGAALLTMRWMDPEEKANHLLQESLEVVDRRGMYSQRHLARPRDLSSKLPYNESDNDGAFGCAFALAELMHYAVLRRQLGADHPEALRIKAVATRASEAMLLLCHVHKRGDGFIARTYLAPHEPIPDGLFFRLQGDGTAQVIDRPQARERGVEDKLIPAPAEIPVRLTHLFTDEGLSEAGLVYKGDTSSDEITLHFLHFLHLTQILGEEDPELCALACEACKRTMGHILDHGCALHDAFGEPTTWAKWSSEYFNSGFGWSDAPLNAIELLMYLRVTMAVTGEAGPWQAAYDDLVAKGYAALGSLHAQRFEAAAEEGGMSPNEWMMYGDHMLATCAFWPLIELEPDLGLRALYRQGYDTWRGSIAREHNPGYDIPYLLACPGAPVDLGLMEHWFYRSPASRLASPVSVEARADITAVTHQNGYQETDRLLPDDERSIAKYDRNPWHFSGQGNDCLVESCYPYTFAFWLGKYYGILE